MQLWKINISVPTLTRPKRCRSHEDFSFKASKVTGACFVEMGFRSICVDVDKEKIKGLKRVRSLIYPGCGYGGSCFLKDVKALIQTSRENGFEPEVLNVVENRNNK